MKILKNKIFLVFVFAILFPLVTPNPTFWITNVGSRTLWIGLIALSMTYMNKNLGLMSLGQLFFAGVTGYTIAILTITHGVNYAVSIPLGLLVFYGACRALGLPEIDLAIRAFTAPVQRRLQRGRVA